MINKIYVVCALVFTFLFIAGIQSCTVVDAGYVGVKRTFGEINIDPLQPGLHFIKPLFIDSVDELETRLKSFEIEASAASKDLQVVSTVISVQHSLNGTLAPKSYAAVGDLDKFDASIVGPAVLESLKAVTAQYTAEELITKREVVKQQTEEQIQKFIDHTLQERDIAGALDVANVAIKDFQFSHEFNSSIEAKVRAQQEALRALNEKTKRITEAEATAREKELAADAESYQIEKVSIQRAESIKREAAALSENPLLLELRAIEKWDGSVPKFSGSSAVPFINLDKE